MTRKNPSNLAASVRQRLMNAARQQGEDFQLVLTRYLIERLLYRLSQSPHAPRFLLKGALLFALWTGRTHRPTRDLDLLGRGEARPEALAEVFRDLCSLDVQPDGVEFAADTIAVEAIREDQEYQGQRVHVEGRLDNARVRLQVDVGFGDAVTPGAEDVRYPTLLEMPAPQLKAYPRETVVAEKLQAMVMLGMANSRMKDFFDLSVLSSEFDFQGAILCKAIGATFKRRGTEDRHAEVTSLRSVALAGREVLSRKCATKCVDGMSETGGDPVAPSLVQASDASLGRSCRRMQTGGETAAPKRYW
jgi:predicted nucleotidyltransferase component of viral defense system